MASNISGRGRGASANIGRRGNPSRGGLVCTGIGRSSGGGGGGELRA